MLRQSAAIGLALVLTSCAGHGVLRPGPESATHARPSGSITDANACAAALGRGRRAERASLAPSAVRLLNWNIQKNESSELRADMNRLAGGADLILLQEATSRSADAARLGDGYHDAFAPGYRSARAVTGVMTISRVPPLTQCSFRYPEPWLRTPKATNVTEYSLGDRDETLLVVNLHLVNFAMGLSDLRMQLAEVVQVIEGHSGPVIVSGDFNTWSRVRDRAVGEALGGLDLDPIDFHSDSDSDLRKRVFGNALDHVFVRGAEVIRSASHGVESSDHNPMSVVLKLSDEEATRGANDVDSR